MKTNETAGDFLERNGKDYYEAGQFNVYKVDEFYKGISLPPNRRDFYKISLVIKSEGILHYADKVIHVKGNALSFANPMIPYSWEGTSETHSGYFCMFTEAFVNNNQLKMDSLSDSPLFKVNGNSFLPLDEKAIKLLTGIFEQMIVEMKSPYKNKYELLRSYVQIIIHEAMKIEPVEAITENASSSARICTLFLELLDRQFPVVSPDYVLQMKSAKEFADQLAVHTNHLNKSVKEITGKTTTELITQRIINEAKYLLLHTSWDSSAIGYCLGFDHASNFNSYFKKHAGLTPNHFRRQVIPIS